MSLFNAMNVSASGLTAQRMRMDIISQNLANVDTTRGPDGPFRRRAVVFQEITPESSFSTILRNRLGINRANMPLSAGVRVHSIIEDDSPGPLVFDPSHPDANADGYVERPNVNSIIEMVNMISAHRSYEANITAMNTTRAMINRTLELAGR